MPQDTPSRKLDQYIVRMPDGMRDRLKAAADANNRSMNAEIVARLEFSFEMEKFDETWKQKGPTGTMDLILETKDQTIDILQRISTEQTEALNKMSRDISILQDGINSLALALQGGNVSGALEALGGIQKKSKAPEGR